MLGLARVWTLVVLAGLTSCTETADLVFVDVDVSMVSCNNSASPASLALYVDFGVKNQSDEPVELISVGLSTVDPSLDAVEGRQTLSPRVTLASGEQKAFSCKDGFALSYPGQNTLTDVRLEVTYKANEVEVTAITYVRMDATVAWDNCQSFIGNARPCAVK